MEELENRLRGRGTETDQQVDTRLANAKTEIRHLWRSWRTGCEAEARRRISRSTRAWQMRRRRSAIYGGAGEPAARPRHGDGSAGRHALGKCEDGDPPSMEELENRLRGRGTETDQQVDTRLANA